MKSLTLLTLLALATPAVAVESQNSVVPADVAERCMQAKDYRGCVGALTGAPIRIDQTNRPGLLAEMGNECPVGTAYVGAGRCRAVICIHGGLFGRNDPNLAGKGHRCPAGIGNYFGYRGSLAWGNSYTNASNNPSCPQKEPAYGYRSSCQGIARAHGTEGSLEDALETVKPPINDVRDQVDRLKGRS